MVGTGQNRVMEKTYVKHLYALQSGYGDCHNDRQAQVKAWRPALCDEMTKIPQTWKLTDELGVERAEACNDLPRARDSCFTPRPRALTWRTMYAP